MQSFRGDIDGIPSLLWGEPSDRLFIAVHGDQSSKADVPIAILAEEAAARGYQTLSFDLPEHGDRKGDARECTPQNCADDLARIMRYARSIAQNISLFGCSIGAHFSLLAYQDEPLRQALFLSPVVDMARMIRNMMSWFDISEARLQQEGTIETPVKTLSWDYYQYVLRHPVTWRTQTAVLRGSEDTLCEPETLTHFAAHAPTTITVLEGGEHYFHTEAQLAFFRQWLRKTLPEG